ncbi:MAG: hypothetical protein ABID87_09335 [Chloroflexota bacterium]
MSENGYNCPICNEKLNRAGEPFRSVRAVAQHVAFKIYHSSTEHKTWAYREAGQKEVDDLLAKARTTKATRDLNALADLLLIPVDYYFNGKAKPGIGFTNS